MATPVQKNLVAANEAYAASFTSGDLALPPAKKYLVLTCMDARIDPAAALGIPLGDAHIIRNAGAWAADALRSIVISQTLLGTREIVLVKHTGCGMLTFKNEDAHALVKEKLGSEAAGEIEGLEFQPFPELEEEVRRDVEWLRGRKVLWPGTVVSGWVYEVETGRVRRVV
ncbi:carbonate dehydratase, partial [Trichodelitschia bisporula]